MIRIAKLPIKSHYDYIGAVLSALCGLHCIVTPLLLLLVPSIHHYLELIWVHSLLICLVAFAFYKSVYSHYQVHKSKLTLASGLVGLSILISIFLLESLHHSGESGHGAGDHHETEFFLIAGSLIGSIFLITSHVLNLRQCECLTEKKVCSAQKAQSEHEG